VSRKASNHAVHRPGDRLCRHADMTVRSLGTPLWKALWKTWKAASCLGKRSAQAVHTRFFDLGTTPQAAISYPHPEVDVQRQPGTLPDLGKAASRSADLPGARLCRRLQFEYVFERRRGRAEARGGGRPSPGDRRVSGGSQHGGRRPASCEAGRHLGNDHGCRSRARRPDREILTPAANAGGARPNGGPSSAKVPSSARDAG
jgi:hypothetical protein